MAGPEDWGAVPAAAPSGPAAWGAVEVNKPAESAGPSVARAAANALGAAYPLGWVAASPAASGLRDEIAEAASAGLHEMNAVNPWGAERTEARARNEAPSMTAVPRAVAGTLAVAGSPVTGAARYVGGHMLDLLNRGMRAGAVKLYGEDKVRKAEAEAGLPAGGGSYETTKYDVDKLMMGLGPRGGMRPAPVAAPAPPKDMLGVMLSEGQETGALPAIRREQAAARGQMGPAAETQAKAFGQEQQGQVAAATEGVRGALDPFGQVIAETPQEAGQVVSQAVQREAAARKADVNAAYDTARSLPGEVEADVFRDMGARIRSDLSGRAEPVIIDEKLTPYASQAIQDIDNRVAQLNIQNRASNVSSLAPTNPQPTIAGVTLSGVDQMRKRLSAFRQQAFGSGNASDGRAVKAVLDSFDASIDHAINNGQFTGDARAIQAWNDARAAHADYRQTFTAQKNDPIGRVIEKITGKTNNPAAIPNDVADFLYGSSGVNPNSLNVGVANRVRSILGDRSPEWSAVKQGLFSRLTESAPGVTDMGPAKIAQRLNRFLNGDGRELAEAVFSPAERNLLQQYADLHRRLEVPPTGVNRSETSTFVAPLLRKIGSKLGMVVGGVLGAAVGHAAGIPFAGEAIGAGTAALSGAVGNAKAARQIATQMPLIAERMAAYQRALAAANRANAPISNRAATVALANLAKSLKPLGVDVYQLAPVRADEKQRERGGRLEQEPGEREGGKAKRADGGETEAHNRPYVRPIPATYSTDLGSMEPLFRAWVAKNKVPFNPDAPVSDYDMRGFYRALVNGDPRAQSAVDPNDSRLHFPDDWKTPQHETFSNQSQWANEDAPQWNERDQLVAPSGHIVFDDRAQQEAPKFAHGGAVQFKDGSEIGLAQNASGVHFQCATCKYMAKGHCHNPDPRLKNRKIKPHWCCNLYDHKGMKVIV